MTATFMITFWAVAFVFFLVCEVATSTALISIWFALGSLVSLFLAIAKVNFLVQCIVFIASSALFLALTRPFVKKIQGKKVATNYELDEGRTAAVIEDIDNVANMGSKKREWGEYPCGSCCCRSQGRRFKAHSKRIIHSGGISMEGIYILLGVLAVIILLIICNIKVVPQAYVYVIERFGAFHAAWGTGLHWKIPLIEKVAKRVSIKEQVVDFQPQSVITKDNVTMQIDTVVFFQITNAMQFTYGVERPISAIENLTATTLRNIVGDLDLEATLTSRDIINTRITAILDEATDRWGIKVQRVELKNILPPREIQDAMERQMKADRERREKVIQAEAEKKSQILVAEGEKESKILRAQADKEAKILSAEADKQSLILQADAIREQKIREAEGEAQAINMVQQAIADSIVKLNEANPNEQVIQLKSLEAFGKAADGRATKIIIPSEIQGLAGLATGIKEVVANNNTTQTKQ